MRRAETPEAERLVPVEDDPIVKAQWATVVQARQAVREAGEALTALRVSTGQAFRDTFSHEPAPRQSTAMFWQAKRRLPDAEERFFAAQADLEEAEARHTEAVALAKSALEPKVRTWLAPRLQDALVALAQVRPALAAAADGVTEASTLGVHAPGPGLLLSSLQMYVTAIEGWLTPPPASSLPVDRVLVACRKPFRLLLTGTIDPNQQTGPGTAYLPGEVLGVNEETADELVRQGRAELVAR